MPPKNNPLGLNPLQRKTLVLFQAMAGDPASSKLEEPSGNVLISRLPYAHGDHFHLAGFLVLAQDATGLSNEAVWRALERKGLVLAVFPVSLRVTPAGLAYDAGMKDILHPQTAENH